MASESPDKTKAKRRSRKRRPRDSDQKLERLNSLPWSSSLTSNDSSDDPFSFFIGSNELEGGFLALEEIDESEYGLEIPKIEVGNVKKQVSDKRKRNKRKNSERNDDIMFDGETVGERDGENDGVKEEDGKRQGKLGKTKKNVKKMKNEDQKNDREDEAVEKTAASDGKDSFDEDSVDEDEYCSWNELRLHPLLMKAIYKLKFKEPTPIQKACISAAAHQGKDVIGTAETGSGKTLAFGLPILQRLLEEQEKVERLSEEKGEASERIAPRGVMRALIVTPTRELALQVTDHIKEVAKGTIFRVVPIVGGMSTKKQERLLKARPEIVVGTPGRLWELMSGGEIHLVELHSLSFFVLDEADRMIESGHFRELQSTVDMLPTNRESTVNQSENTQSCTILSSLQRKKRQTFVFSATLALSADFRKKLKRGSLNSKKRRP